MDEKNKGTRKVHFDSTYQQYPSVPDAAPESNPQEVAGKLEHGVASQYQKFKARSPVEWVESVFPIVEWLRTYDFKEHFLADIIAGLTVAAVVVPQGISYSMLAGMPVQFGLYCSVVPVYAYSVFGTSRQAAVGTSALSSLTFQSVVMPLVNPSGKLRCDFHVKNNLDRF